MGCCGGREHDENDAKTSEIKAPLLDGEESSNPTVVVESTYTSPPTTATTTTTTATAQTPNTPPAKPPNKPSAVKISDGSAKISTGSSSTARTSSQSQPQERKVSGTKDSAVAPLIVLDEPKPNNSTTTTTATTTYSAPASAPNSTPSTPSKTVTLSESGNALKVGRRSFVARRASMGTQSQAVTSTYTPTSSGTVTPTPATPNKSRTSSKSKPTNDQNPNDMSTHSSTESDEEGPSKAKPEEEEEEEIQPPSDDEDEDNKDKKKDNDKKKDETKKDDYVMPEGAIPFEEEKTPARAQWDYNADPNDAEQISFKAGDIIYILEQGDEWWYGELNGKEGYFPANYLKIEKKELKIKTDVDARIALLQQKIMSPREEQMQ